MLKQDRVADFVAAYKDKGKIRACAKAMGIGYATAHKIYRKAVDAGLIQGKPKAISREEMKDEGRVHPLETGDFGTPEKGKVRRYILTCAQNNTKIHRDVWENLQALAVHYEAQILVSRFVYDKRSQRGMDKANIGQSLKGPQDVWWPAEVVPYLNDERVTLAPGLVWCGEMNILPTAVRPLSGMENYTGRRSAIFPHAKIAMESVASAKHEGTKFIYTTGTVTLRNYIQRKAGLKAEFHHCYGALLVEVDSEGSWWVRQLNADSEGVIYDLTLKVDNGEVIVDNRIEAVTWGDIHIPHVDEEVHELCWFTEGSVMAVLEPKYQFMHDVIDFRARNWHDKRDPHKLFEKHIAAEESVEDEVKAAALFIGKIDVGGCRTVVVDSNHDRGLEGWLRDSDFRHDPVNAVYYLRASLAKYEAMACGDDRFHVLDWAVNAAYGGERAQFLREDESFIICREHGDGIECGMHGDRGPNGSRGGAVAFVKMGRKANIGHSHSAGIMDGVYTSGITGKLDQKYNKGPSSWSHSHIVTYPNGKRTIITFWNGKWRA